MGVDNVLLSFHCSPKHSYFSGKEDKAKGDQPVLGSSFSRRTAVSMFKACMSISPSNSNISAATGDQSFSWLEV